MSYGRRKIFSDTTEITAANIVEEVNAAYPVHSDNRNEIRDLYRYYRNKTAIESKTKEVRESINHKVGEARCLEVTNFYKGYTSASPFSTYVGRRPRTAPPHTSDITEYVETSPDDDGRHLVRGCGFGTMFLSFIVWELS